MQKNSLLTLQQRFSRCLQSSSFLEDEILSLGILTQPPISIQERFDIYHNAYHQRILESLEEDFPLLKQALGEENFSKLCREYLTKYPSEYWTLAEVGKNLSQFISQSALNNENHASQSTFLNYKYLAELANFEWTKILSTLAPIPSPIDFSFLGSLEEDKQENIKLKFHDSVYLLKFFWNFTEVSQPICNLGVECNEVYYIIYQKDGEGVHHLLPYQQWKLANKISQGCTIKQFMFDSEDISENDVTNLFTFFAAENIIVLDYFKEP